MSKRVLLSLLSVLLLSLAWLGGGGLFLLPAFVPLLLLLEEFDKGRRPFWKAYGWVALTFGLWCAACTWWVWYAAAVGTIAATIIQMTLFGAVMMLYHYFRLRTKRSFAYLVLVTGWIAAEHLYLRGQVSFPWLLLGNGFANQPWAVQWYEWTGVFGGSLWVLLANIAIFEAVRAGKGCKPKAVMAAVVVVLPIIVSGVVALCQPKYEELPKAKVTVVQPNFEPYEEKYTIPREQQDMIMLSLASEAPKDVDFIVLPETVLGDISSSEWIWEEQPLSSEVMRRYNEFMASHYPEAEMVVGAMTSRRYMSDSRPTRTARQLGIYWLDRYNTAFRLNGTDTLARHHKSKLVIGVEMMPDWKILNILENTIVSLGGTTGGLGTDNFVTVFRDPRGKNAPSSAQICYESIYGEHFSKPVAEGAEVMFVITNDGWWHDTPGHRQHFSYSRLRAIENRRSIARSANTGISGFITPTGKVLDERLGWDERGTITAEVPLNSRVTFYSRMGDYIARISNLLFPLAILYYVAIYFRRKAEEPTPKPKSNPTNTKKKK
ncbi:MAG: apolipoprotein N-acyltransferase [Tidjanibacter sp.]|nr:apolipoprotein N-acyltransferase [Tidjanibacter sp.]